MRYGWGKIPLLGYDTKPQTPKCLGSDYYLNVIASSEYLAIQSCQRCGLSSAHELRFPEACCNFNILFQPPPLHRQRANERALVPLFIIFLSWWPLVILEMGTCLPPHDPKSPGRSFHVAPMSFSSQLGNGASNAMSVLLGSTIADHVK
jgi:hypothetical protein